MFFFITVLVWTNYFSGFLLHLGYYSLSVQFLFNIIQGETEGYICFELPVWKIGTKQHYLSSSNCSSFVKVNYSRFYTSWLFNIPTPYRRLSEIYNHLKKSDIHTNQQKIRCIGLLISEKQQKASRPHWKIFRLSCFPNEHYTEQAELFPNLAFRRTFINRCYTLVR